jgi:hypothetical protein
MRAAVVAGMAFVLAACGSPVDDLSAMTGGHEVVELARTDALHVGAYDDGSSTCFAYRATAAGSAGVHCMRALGPGGWAVETSVHGSGPAAFVLLAADPAVAEIRVPRKSGGELEVRPRRLAGVPMQVEVLTADVAALDLGGNGVTAYDEAGVLLGRTHDCAGLGGTDDCGPYDGVFDQRLTPAPSPSPS